MSQPSVFPILCMFVAGFFGSWPHPVFGCSAFSPAESALLAANYDWRVGGGMILSNASGWQKTAYLSPQYAQSRPAKWTARYASLTLTQWGRDFPVQGMNSRGLAGVVLNAPMAAPSSGSLGSISEQQWLQYQLDNYHDVEEVVKHVHDLGISPISGQLHYFLCDRTHSCIWVEFSKGQASVYSTRSGALRAITNSSYSASQARWQEFLQTEGTESDLPKSYQTLDRLIRGSWFSLNKSPVDDSKLIEALHNLSGVGLTNWHTLFPPFFARNRSLFLLKSLGTNDQSDRV